MKLKSDIFAIDVNYKLYETFRAMKNIENMMQENLLADGSTEFLQDLISNLSRHVHRKIRVNIIAQTNTINFPR